MVDPARLGTSVVVELLEGGADAQLGVAEAVHDAAWR